MADHRIPVNYAPPVAHPISARPKAGAQPRPRHLPPHTEYPIPLGRRRRPRCAADRDRPLPGLRPKREIALAARSLALELVDRRQRLGRMHLVVLTVSAASITSLSTGLTASGCFSVCGPFQGREEVGTACRIDRQGVFSPCCRGSAFRARRVASTSAASGSMRASGAVTAGRIVVTPQRVEYLGRKIELHLRLAGLC